MSLQTADPIAQAADLLAQGDVTSAERIAEMRMSRGVDHDTLHLLALVRIRQNRPEEAIGLLRRGLALQPGHAPMLLNLGKVLGLLKRDDEAAKALQEAGLAQPDLVETWQELGEVQQRRGDSAAAETAFRKVLALEPGNALAKLSLGVLLKDADRAEEGEALLAQGFAEVPDGLLKAAFAYNLAFAQYDQGRKEAALANFTLVRSLDPSRSSNVDLNRANLLCELSRFEEAEALLKDLIRRDPLNDWAHQNYNKLLYVLKREDEFLASYDLAPADTKLSLGKATLLHNAGRVAEAEEIYAGILAGEPDNHDAVTGRAAVLNKLGRHAEALACLEVAAARAPGNYRLYTAIAGAALQGGDPERAAVMAEKAVVHSPDDQYMVALLGLAWRLTGDERDELLNGYDDLIQVFDLDPPPGFSDMAAFNAELDGWLGTLHPSNREPVNQSLRVGNQTWGKIFGAGYDLVERARFRISEAMDRYIAGIKPRDGHPFPIHPFAGRRRQGFRYTGSWSSRLSDCGYHVNHIHPQGWISSCYYVGVPEAVNDAQSQQGWIKFGEPGFELGLKPRRAVQPVPGRLVLFPSYMWHGTIPFHGAATRTTIAFDAVPGR